MPTDRALPSGSARHIPANREIADASLIESIAKVLEEWAGVEMRG